ncbi:MAG: hypothetical protein WC175_04955 [Candidatus Dojkabacteria bacterium]
MEVNMQQKDFLKLKDVPKNRVVFKDKDGNVLFERTNLVVQRGRIFTLERLINRGIGDADINVTDRNFQFDNPNRKLYFFSVGNGGTAGGPFFPAQPSPTNDDLENKVPFILVEEGESVDVHTYPLPPTPVGDSDGYFGKGFENPPVFNIDLLEDGDGVDNLVSLNINLQIDSNECRNLEINELGLYFAEVDASGAVIPGSAELFSRVTFPSEIMTAEKTLYITYTIYA